MEVRHHPIDIGSYTSSLPAGKAEKNGLIISGPAFGGILLFLAAFCGFLAGYQLEH